MEKTVVVSARLPEGLVAWVDGEREKEGRSRCGWLSYYLRGWLERKRREVEDARALECGGVGVGGDSVRGVLPGGGC